jgi:Protein of unknown function (DUF3435)
MLTYECLKHHLPRRIDKDTAAIVRGLEPQGELMRAACRMLRSMNPDRPWKLTTEQSLSVNKHPRVRKLILRRDKLRADASRRPEYDRLTKEITNEKQRQRYALRLDIRKKWDNEQAVITIERQLAGVKFSEDVKTKLDSTERTPEHNRLIETIMTLPGSTLEEEIRRRNAAINAIIAYCKVEEGGAYPLERRARQTQPTGGVSSMVFKKDTQAPPVAADPVNEELNKAMLSVYKEKRPTICFLCLGRETLPINKRVYSFSTPGDLSKHFKRKHLLRIKKGQPIECNVCKISLEHKMHLQNHALRIHGTVS